MMPAEVVNTMNLPNKEQISEENIQAGPLKGTNKEGKKKKPSVSLCNKTHWKSKQAILLPDEKPSTENEKVNCCKSAAIESITLKVDRWMNKA